MKHRLPAALLALLLATPLLGPQAHADEASDDIAIANSLAAMLRAGRAVISANQDRINDPALGPKGLDGKTVLSQAVINYRTSTQSDPLATDPASRQGKLLRLEMDAIVSVVDSQQERINQPGVGFKGFIPAVFSRLVGETFTSAAGGSAGMSVTAPANLVRNRRWRPDALESRVISEKFLAPGWHRGQAYTQTTALDAGGKEFRMLMPEYYAASCLTCHGGPKGSIDITGYPREGAAEGDLGGVISIRLSH